MADFLPLNDPDLEQLERRLQSANWSVAAPRREHMLYACGQAAGRAQMMRRVRATTAVAALLACVSVGLGVSLSVRSPAPTAIADRPHESPPQELTGSSQPELPRHDPVADGFGGDRQTLRASANFGALASAEREQRPTAGLQATDPLPTSRILTAGGPPPTEL